METIKNLKYKLELIEGSLDYYESAEHISNDDYRVIEKLKANKAAIEQEIKELENAV